MAPPLRMEYPGAVYHISSLGNEKKPVFERWGLGQQTIWNKVRGQSLLGKEEFDYKLVDHLTKPRDVPEIPRSRRYADRPSLEKIFSERIKRDISNRNRAINEAAGKHGTSARVCRSS